MLIQANWEGYHCNPEAKYELMYLKTGGLLGKKKGLTKQVQI